MDNYIGSIRIFPFDWAPAGFALCNGQTLPIAQNQALYALLGTAFGGDGRNTFGLPNLQTRVPLHIGHDTSVTGTSTYSMGNTGGTDAVVLTTANLPPHNHMVNAYDQADVNNNSPVPGGSTFGYPAVSGGVNPFNLYASALTGPVPLAAASVDNNGGNGDHVNDQPSLVLNYCICTSGVFPSRN